jgi:acetylornithine/succinyldiaminopimelate/putrescine aminotransferase
VNEAGSYFKDRLTELVSKFPHLIKEVRGRGLMLGVEVKHSAELIMKMGIEHKIIFNVAGGGTTLRFVPPLIIEKSHIDQAISILSSVFTDIGNTNN